MGAFEEFGCAAKRTAIDRHGCVPSAAEFCRAEDAVVPDAVGIDFSGGAEAGVKIVLGFLGGDHAESGNQSSVESADPSGWFES